MGHGDLSVLHRLPIRQQLEFDISALMGYTGAVFNRFFGSGLGIITAGATLAVWLAVPTWIGLRIFDRKDF